MLGQCSSFKCQGKADEGIIVIQDVLILGAGDEKCASREKKIQCCKRGAGMAGTGAVCMRVN